MSKTADELLAEALQILCEEADDASRRSMQWMIDYDDYCGARNIESSPITTNPEPSDS